MVVALCGAGTLANAAPTVSRSLSLATAMGHESQTSPLFQVTPDSTLVYLDGLERLEGSYASTYLQGFGAVSFDEGTSLSVAGAISEKRAPQSPDLDFRLLSLTPSVSWPALQGNINLGIDMQHLFVARQGFRTVRGLQADWTHIDGKEMWALLGEVGTFRHPQDLQALDADFQTVILQHNTALAWQAFHPLEMTALYSRESNAAGYAELSSRKGMLYAAIHWDLMNLQWMLGTGAVRGTFDEVSFAGEPERRDNTTFADISASYEFSKTSTVKLEFNNVRNDSTTHLYDNRYDNITLSVGWFLD